ncbi:MAG TPA: SRPBCC family protein [Thermoleophilaceae bacterium]|nr:SRPBCC family protein [Thermoleophilaceae bacterium]
MRAHRVHVSHDFAKPPERVFAYMCEHENLGPLFNAEITRVCDGDTDRNGVNSVRKLKVGPLPPFEETVHEYVPGERIVYRITKGGPLKDHVGVLEFSPTPSGGTHLEYNIRIASAIPGLAPIVASGLTRDISKNLPLVDERA